MSMLELFRLEAESHVQALTIGLLALERDPAAMSELEGCMRAAHSIKGAARIVDLTAGVAVAHSMEDCFVAAQRGDLTLRQRQIDQLLQGVDLLSRIANTHETELPAWAAENTADVEAFLSGLQVAMEGPDDTPSASSDAVVALPILEPESALLSGTQSALAAEPRDGPERMLRVGAANLNRLLGLAGESLVESRWLEPFSESLLRLKRLHHGAGRAVDDLREALLEQALNEQTETAISNVQHRVLKLGQLLSQHLVELEMFDRRFTNLAHRLYEEALACRMRPFADGLQVFPRMVRDLARSLGKQARLQIVGETTPVDRDILEKLDAPLGHLLRNAIDHGIEPPDERGALGKPAQGVVHLEARHSAGMLQITVSDDGRGIDLGRLREEIVRRNLSDKDIAGKLSEAELLEFLFLPGFTMRDSVTEISGRGVGLDAVQTMIKQVRGAVRVSSQPGAGARFLLHLPLSLSVLRTMLVEVGGEPYAFPLAHIARTLKLPRDQIEVLEGRQLFRLDGGLVGLVSAQQILQGGQPSLSGDTLSVIVIGEAGHTYGLVADRLLGERELVVQPLDARLGKIKDIAAGGLMEDGSPVLIVDVEDLVRSVEKLIAAGNLSTVRNGAEAASSQRKRVLVVDDSLTVRELERKLLDNAGYEVEVAVNGMDAWNATRTGHFDLVVTDVDMPRMHGIELVTLIKKDPNLKSLPVMIVSYKDHEQDRQRGFEAGADYYLSKGSFHDETLLQAVVDLIGEAVT
jgi:two-component system sensor histidine kinase and response regulator WspE